MTDVELAAGAPAPKGARHGGHAVPARLASLDVLRGAAVVAMVLVNFPAIGPVNYYHQLEHSTWNGLTFADVIYPAFLVVSGVSMHFSLDRYVTGRAPRRLALGRIGRRFVLLFSLGLLVNNFGLALGAPGNVRIPGVLQRIAIAYLLASLAVLYLRPRYQVLLVCAVLLGYWAALSWIPVPIYGAGMLTPHGNLAGYVDRIVFGPSHMLANGTLGYDPEGLLGSIVALCNVLFGYWAGMFLRARRPRRLTLTVLAAAAAAGIGTGYLWSLALPLNKKMWTPSFVMVTTGYALAALTIGHLVLDGHRRVPNPVTLPLRVLGLNAIVMYVGSEITGGLLDIYHHAVAYNPSATIAFWLWSRFLEPAFGASGGSLVYAFCLVVAWSLVASFLYRMRWFLRA